MQWKRTSRNWLVHEGNMRTRPRLTQELPCGKKQKIIQTVKSRSKKIHYDSQRTSRCESTRDGQWKKCVATDASGHMAAVNRCAEDNQFAILRSVSLRSGSH